MAIQPIFQPTSTIATGTGTGPSPQYWNNTISAQPLPKQYAIQGQMYATTYTVDNLQIHEMTKPFDSEEIKMQLTYKLAEELYKNKAIEFTKSEDIMHGTHTFRARIYAVPDTMVRILRENGK